MANFIETTPPSFDNVTLETPDISMDEPDLKGALGDLNYSKYDIGTYKYPLEIQALGDSVRHWVTFYINVQESSKYNKEENTVTNIDSSDPAYQNTDFLQKGKFVIKDPTAVVESTALYGGAVGAVKGVLGNSIKEDGFLGMVTDTGKSAGKGAIVGAGAGMVINRITTRPKTKRLKESVSIYMPDTLLFNHSHDYTSTSLTDMLQGMGAAAQIGSSAINDLKQSTGFGDFMKRLEGITQTAGGAEVAGKIVNKALQSTGEASFNNVEDLLVKSYGFAINPQVEMIFKGTNRRQFMFDFKFNARSKKEAQEIMNIIRVLRKHAAPALAGDTGGGGSRYFIPPANFDIKFYFDGAENPYITKIGTCVLETIDVNYAGAGRFISFEDGNPVDIDMRLSFREIDIILQDHIEAGY